MASKSRGAVAPSRAKTPSKATKTASRHSGAKPHSGGGIRGLKVKTVPGNYGPPSTNVVHPGAVSELGYATGGKRTGDRVGSENYARPLYGAPSGQVKSGNQVAWETNCKPGGSREVYRTGYQSLHGQPAQGVKDTAPDVPGTAPSKRGIDARGKQS
jgi:hypothetical protein